MAAIVGGVIGGIAAITIIIVAIFYLRRRRSLGLSKSAESTGIDASQPHMDEISRPAATMKLYVSYVFVNPRLSVFITYSNFSLFPCAKNPDDPTTFPGYQDNAQLDVPPQVPTSSHVESGSNLLKGQTSLPQPAGYHGLTIPTV